MLSTNTRDGGGPFLMHSAHLECHVTHYSRNIAAGRTLSKQKIRYEFRQQQPCVYNTRRLLKHCWKDDLSSEPFYIYASFKYLAVQRTISASPQKAAKSKGVRPFLSIWSILEPLSTRHWTTALWPLRQAQLRAVNPSLSTAAMSAPKKGKTKINKIKLHT